MPATPLGDLVAAHPAAGYCARCGALRYRGEGERIICSGGCTDSLITPVPELADRETDFRLPGDLTTDALPFCPGCTGGCGQCRPDWFPTPERASDLSPVTFTPAPVNPFHDRDLLWCKALIAELRIDDLLRVLDRFLKLRDEES